MTGLYRANQQLDAAACLAQSRAPPLPPPLGLPPSTTAALHHSARRAAADRALIDEMATEARKISSGGTLLGPNDAEQTLITMSTLTGAALALLWSAAWCQV